MEFKLTSLLLLVVGLVFVSTTRAQRNDPYNIEVARNFEDSSQNGAAPSDPSPFKNGARPSFRQYNTNGNANSNSNGYDYSNGQQQQYGYSNGQQQFQYGGQYTPYDNSQQAGQRYPGNQNGIQRDPRFNSAPNSMIGASMTLFSVISLSLMQFVLN